MFRGFYLLTQQPKQTRFDVDVQQITTITYIMRLTIISISALRCTAIFTFSHHRESSVSILLSIHGDSFLFITRLCWVTARFMELCYVAAVFFCCLYCLTGTPQEISHC